MGDPVIPAIGSTWLRTDSGHRGKGRTVKIETVSGEGPGAVVSYLDSSGRRYASLVKRFSLPARFVPQMPRENATEANAPADGMTAIDRLETLARSALEKAERAMLCNDMPTASTSLAVFSQARREIEAMRPSQPKSGAGNDLSDASDKARTLTRTTSAFSVLAAGQVDTAELCRVLKIDHTRPLTRNEERALGYAAMAMVEKKPE